MAPLRLLVGMVFLPGRAGGGLRGFATRVTPVIAGRIRASGFAVSGVLGGVLPG